MSRENRDIKADVRILRKMKILSDQQGIINRYLREKDVWNEHLENSKSFITGCLKKRMARNILILGSGWLLDLPAPMLMSFRSTS